MAQGRQRQNLSATTLIEKEVPDARMGRHFSSFPSKAAEDKKGPVETSFDDALWRRKTHQSKHGLSDTRTDLLVNHYGPDSEGKSVLKRPKSSFLAA